MWCNNCGRDQNELPTERSHASFCELCGALLSGPAQVSEAESAPHPNRADVSPRGASDWGFENLDSSCEVTSELRFNTFHEAHETPPPYFAEARRQLQAAPKHRHASPLAWMLLSFGIAILMCGGVLMGWSFVGARSELWTVGTPLALAGQALVLIGLVLQMDVIWQSSRDTSVTLVDIDDQISELKRTASEVSLDHTAETRLIRHPAHETTPQMLIADLKGRLDMLSAQVAQHEQNSK